MSFFKWIITLLLGLFKSSFKDTFKSLVQHNIGESIEIKMGGEWNKAVILKTGEDYMVIMSSSKEYFIPFSSVQGIRLTDFSQPDQ
jgi:hypothetical protein